MQLLDYLNDKYYISATGLYAESINSTTLVKSTSPSACYLWSAAHTMRALLWGSMVDSKYDARLQSYVNMISWYTNGEGYGCIKGGERFFDDNGLIGDVLMDVYQKKIRTQAVLDKSLFALNYVIKYKDAQWGLPQKESGLNKGIFYMGPVDPLSNAYAKYYTLSGNADYLAIAKTYFDKFNDYALKLKDPTTLLLKSTTTYANGVWTPANEGPRACNTAAVVLLGIKLYQITGEAKYLNNARAMADAILKNDYKLNGAFAEVSFWGGNYAVEMLCEMYDIDRDIKWYNAAKNIVDFLIDKSRDNKGFYPSGSSSDGYWNVVRTNDNPPTDIALISQACAADAILRFAYLDLHKALPMGLYKITNAGTGRALSVKLPNTSTDGSLITTADYTSNDYQQWKLAVDYQGYYSFVSLKSKSPIDVVGCTYTDAANLELNASASGDCMKFKVEDAGNGQFKILNKVANALDAGTTNQNDDPIYLSTFANVNNQKWIVERLQTNVELTNPTNNSIIHTPGPTVLTVNATGGDGTISKVEYYLNYALLGTSTIAPYSYSWNSNTSGSYTVMAIAYDNSGNSGVTNVAQTTVLCNNIPEGVYKINNVGRNKCLSINSATAAQDNALVAISDYTAQNYQKWNVSIDNGYYSFAAVNKNYKIGLDSCKTVNGTNLKQSSSDIGDCQKYSIYDLGNGQYQIYSKFIKKGLDGGTSSLNDAPIYIWSIANVNNQKWTFEWLGYTDIQVENISENNKVIYYNPMNNILSVKSADLSTNVEIYSLLGQKVIQRNTKQIDVSSFNAGIYLVIATFDNGRVCKTKFIKQ